MSNFSEQDKQDLRTLYGIQYQSVEKSKQEAKAEEVKKQRKEAFKEFRSGILYPIILLILGYLIGKLS